MKVEKIAKICCGQDGAIINGLLFRLDVTANVNVYDLKTFSHQTSFKLEGLNDWFPHSNCAFFGNQYFDKNDEFPLLYTNVYNTYNKEENRREGTLLAYRIVRQNGVFTSTLLQVIKIDFIDNLSIWKSLEDNKDVRPFGNFLQDSLTNKLWAFTMRDKEKTTRFISFNMPKFDEGVLEGNVKVKYLTEKDILSFFDIAYQFYLQGACMKDGIIYSLEGFGENTEYKNVLRLIDVENKKEIKNIALGECGCVSEPECIDFDNEQCYYGDGTEDLYKIHF